jgi:hypothetical protein
MDTEESDFPLSAQRTRVKVIIINHMESVSISVESFFAFLHVSVPLWWMSSFLFPEALQDRQPESLAFLGMELDSEDVILPDARD